MCWQLAHWGAAINPLLYADLAKVPWRQYPGRVTSYQRVAALPAWRAASGHQA